MFYGPQGMEVPRVLGIGMGARERLDGEDFRFAVGRALRQCRELRLEFIGIDGSALQRVAGVLGLSLADTVREAVAAAHMSLYSFDQWKSKKEPEGPRRLTVLLTSSFVDDGLRASVRMAEAESAGISLARDLANSPANALTPQGFAARAEETARRYGMAFRCLGPEELASEGMEAYLAVCRGSAEEPRMSVVTYTPKGAEGRKPVVLVGKGLCFDSGGISLKPAKGMEAMKADMSGAAAVLGVMEALGRLAPSYVPQRPVVAVMACAENMPGGHATRPGDIVRARNGKTIEIVNTDAEGRLVLADALAWALDQGEPERIIDIATLTGACEVALGKRAAGLFSADEALAERLHREGMRLGETNWRLPLWEKASLNVLQSPCADLQNSGVREGGALHAAAFLKQFTGNACWAHIDMAGADNDDTPVNAKGCTGFGVRTLLSAVWDE
jgi:leucyl aminopeptidase